MGIFSGLTNKTKKFIGSTSSPKLGNTTTVYLKYSNILFRTFFDVATTGNLSLLIVEGPGTEEELLEVWEEIVKLDDEAKGNNQYNKVFKNHVGYLKLKQKKLYVQTCLFSLYLERDEQIIKELKTLGYIVDDKRYYESIESALRKSGNLTTKIMS